jgi:predicted transposase/invertase (TIGR01784 family)
MDVISKAEEKLTMLSADPETRKEYERRAKALSDERCRLEDARESGIEIGIISVIQGLLSKGMPLHEAAKLTPYTVEELNRMLNEIEK